MKNYIALVLGLAFFASCTKETLPTPVTPAATETVQSEKWAFELEYNGKTYTAESYLIETAPGQSGQMIHMVDAAKRFYVDMTIYSNGNAHVDGTLSGYDFTLEKMAFDGSECIGTETPKTRKADKFAVMYMCGGGPQGILVYAKGNKING